MMLLLTRAFNLLVHNTAMYWHHCFHKLKITKESIPKNYNRQRKIHITFFFTLEDSLLFLLEILVAHFPYTFLLKKALLLTLSLLISLENYVKYIHIQM